MKVLGWGLLLVTLLYPWDAVRTWFLVRNLIASEAQPVPLGGSGMSFDLKTSRIHCSIVGWLGGVGTLLSLVWLLVALVAWVGRRVRHEPPLGVSSRVVVAAVLAGVLASVGTQQFFERVHGVRMM